MLSDEDERWPLALFDDCFPGRMGMSDCDGIFERKGKFLLLEFKRPGARVPTAHKIMLTSFARLPGCSALLVFCEAPCAPTEDLEDVSAFDEQACTWQTFGADAKTQEGTLGALKDSIREWYAWAVS